MQFGLTEWQVRNALNFLEEKGLIFRELRDIIIENQILNNVLYIGIYRKKILEITGKSDSSILSTYTSIYQDGAQKEKEQIQTQQLTSPSSQPKIQGKDWSAKFPDEQKTFLDYLLKTKPEIGDHIERDHATWWIKSYGIEKIQVALQVYWQQVEKAKKDFNVPMPQNISNYVRYALNNAINPIQSSVEQLANQNAGTICGLEKANHVVDESKPGVLEKQTTYTEISMMFMFVNEVNDSASLTFQKDDKKEILRGQIKETNLKKTNAINSFYLNNQKINKQQFKKVNQKYDCRETFTPDEKRFLTYLLNLIPAIGEKIEEKHATWWIKNFGIDKIKVALQVYWQ